jgi:DNA (cytosine-5)-methyltransferase 1
MATAPLTYLSVCSGIEAATVAWQPLGFQPLAFAEIDAFPSAVLAYHYPAVPNWGDLTQFKDWPNAHQDILVGGTPCQAFSVAGLRQGLADLRGNLTLTYLAVAQRYRPRWVVWENVPGVLSINGGRVFGGFLWALGELGYGWTYRVLDAQYFGVAQRRRRVFVVGYLGDWRRAAAVLFERESLSGHPAPRRETGEAAPTVPSRRSAGGGLGTDFDCVPALTACGGTERKHGHGWGQQELANGYAIPVAHSLRADGFDASEDGTGRGTPIVPIDLRQASRGEKITNNRAHGSGGAPGHGVGNAGDPAFTVSERGQAIAFSVKDHGADAGALAPTLRAAGHTSSHANGGCMPAVAFDARQSDVIQYGEKTGPLDTDGHMIGIQSVMQVRRLTPRECERLQGFPDDYTLISYRGKVAADGPRYKALGNSMAVPVVRGIGRRLAAVDALTDEELRRMI